MVLDMIINIILLPINLVLLVFKLLLNLPLCQISDYG